MTHTYDDEQVAMNGVYPSTPEKEAPTPQDRQAIAQVLCDLLEGEKYMINNPHLSHEEEEEYVHNVALEQAQALIRQTLDPISSNE